MANEGTKKAKEDGVYVGDERGDHIRIRAGGIIPPGYSLRPGDEERMKQATIHNEEGAPIEVEPTSNEPVVVAEEEEEEEEVEVPEGEAKPKPKRNR